MPSKYRIILEMASQTARDIASNADRYTDFLITAANNYKYSFKEQLLIHAQKPDATACAEIDTWNKLGRWVNKGTKGIALLIDRDVPYKLRHVFDISDTNSRAGRNITLWQMKPEYEYAVSESLQASFGDVEEPRDFPHLLMDISGYAVEDNLSDYLMELNAVKAGSFLEELDDTSLEAWLKTTLKSSVAFMALSRAGYEPRRYFDREDFSHLFDFNTVEVISVLGAAVSDISEMVIREMGETVKEMEKEGKRKIRTFAQTDPSAYHKNRTENKERSNEYGTDLYDAGGLSDSRSDRAGEPEAWEVWNAAADIPPRTPGWDLHRDAAERDTEQPSGGSGPTSQRDDGTPDLADDEGTGRDGEPESGGSDAVGADDELHSSLGGGSDSERPDLRVTLPTVEQQQEIIAEAEEEKSSAFAISQEDIDAILTRGSGIHQGKFRIYEQFLKQDSSENNITFLKNEYGIGGAYPAVSGRNLDESHDAKGIKISRGRISQPDAELLLRWNKVEKRIGELIRADRYLSQAEKDDYPAYREQAEVRKERCEISDEFRSMLYTQLFQQLYYQADSVHGGRLPVHVHFVMDEFANVALPDEFDKLLSTMRSREISVSIIIQNLAQLKALFEKQWESIVGNCDEFLYLGGNEQSTHEYVSKLLGKETIDTNTYGRSRGRNGSYSTNYQLAGRELMTPDEVRMLDNRYALLFIRGERPIRDLKYDILHHPNVALTTDGSAPAYTHGEDTRSIASMAFSFDKKAVKNAEKLEAEKHEFLLYSEEELEELLDEKEKKDNEET